MEEESKMVLRTEDLVKKYGKRTVVSHVSINVKQGEIVGLLGLNGAGKTTSFYMTVGLITPNEGRIFLDDLVLRNILCTSARRQVSVIWRRKHPCSVR